MQEQIDKMEKKVDQIHDALVGTKLNPKGLMSRVGDVEDYQSKDKKHKWMALGAIGVLTFFKDHIISFFTS
jgi:hypothetical protein